MSTPKEERQAWEKGSTYLLEDQDSFGLILGDGHAVDVGVLFVVDRVVADGEDDCTLQWIRRQ